MKSAQRGQRLMASTYHDVSGTRAAGAATIASFLDFASPNALAVSEQEQYTHLPTFTGTTTTFERRT